MARHPVLELPLSTVMRPEIAMPLQQIFHLHTVGSFLKAWRSPRNQKAIEQIFDTPEQARHAVAVCATWLGVYGPNTTMNPVGGWWPEDSAPPLRV